MFSEAHKSVMVFHVDILDLTELTESLLDVIFSDTSSQPTDIDLLESVGVCVPCVVLFLRRVLEECFFLILIGLICPTQFLVWTLSDAASILVRFHSLRVTRVLTLLVTTIIILVHAGIIFRKCLLGIGSAQLKADEHEYCCTCK